MSLPVLYFISFEWNDFLIEIITRYPCPHFCCIFSRLCTWHCESLYSFLCHHQIPSPMFPFHQTYLFLPCPSQLSPDISPNVEARIKRLRERAGRKYTYVRILLRFVKKTIERRKNKPTRFLCSFCVSSYHLSSPAATSVPFSHIAQFVGLTLQPQVNLFAI